MSIARITILFEKKLFSTMLNALTVPVFVSLILGLSHGLFGDEHQILVSAILLDLFPMIAIGGTALGLWGTVILENLNRTAESLFSTPITTLEYMISACLRGIFISILTIYIPMIIFTLPLVLSGRLPDISPLIWLQPLPLAITWMSSSGVLACIILHGASLIKRMIYMFVVFLPLGIITALISIMFVIQFFELSVYTATPGSFLYRIMEIADFIRPFIPDFIFSPWVRWLPSAIYLPPIFLLLARRIHVGRFILPSSMMMK